MFIIGSVGLIIVFATFLSNIVNLINAAVQLLHMGWAIDIVINSLTFAAVQLLHMG